MAAEHPQASDPREGVDRLRETDPKGPGQFDSVLNTKLKDEQSADEKPVPALSAPRPQTIPGLDANHLGELQKLETKYAAARRAAIAGGRTTLYE